MTKSTPRSWKSTLFLLGILIALVGTAIYFTWEKNYAYGAWIAGGFFILLATIIYLKGCKAWKLYVLGGIFAVIGIIAALTVSTLAGAVPLFMGGLLMIFAVLNGGKGINFDDATGRNKPHRASRIHTETLSGKRAFAPTAPPRDGPDDGTTRMTARGRRDPYND